MKKISIILFLLYSFNNCYSQSTLEFNQVIWNTFSGVTGTTFTITVPANKVWKIESAGITILSGGNASVLRLEDVEIAHNFYTSTTNTTNSPYNRFPIWLPTGSYVLSVYNISGTAKAFISAIEYNVVP